MGSDCYSPPAIRMPMLVSVHKPLALLNKLKAQPDLSVSSISFTLRAQVLSLGDSSVWMTSRINLCTESAVQATDIRLFLYHNKASSYCRKLLSDTPISYFTPWLHSCSADTEKLFFMVIRYLPVLLLFCSWASEQVQRKGNPISKGVSSDGAHIFQT